MKIYNLKNRIANNYIVGLDEGGYVLIDTGYVEGYHNFLQQFEKTGVSPKDIKYVFLTHAHDDHAGFLNDVLALTDAKVILHPKAIERLLKGQNPFIGGCSSRLAWLFCQILKLFGKGEHKFPPIKEEYLNRLITIDSEEFKSLSLPFEVIETPGHTADHIALLKDGILFCGDAAMNGFPSLKRVIIWIENLEQYKQSWDKMIALNPKMIYPSHGKPFPTKDLVKYQRHLNNIRLSPL
ncbi:MAG: MBL fold metallo-hydrolase [Bacteroidales bacterium]|nr:MBL fold metallo-hydrolase [Bacteroidales bacterium]